MTRERGNPTAPGASLFDARRSPYGDGKTYKAEEVRGPIHLVDAGRYYAVLREGVPMIERADTTGAVLAVEDTQ